MKKHILGMIAAAMLSGAAMAQEAEKKVLSQYYRNALTNMMVYHPEAQKHLSSSRYRVVRP